MDQSQDSKIHKCNLCTETFSKEIYLQIHKRDVHDSAKSGNILKRIVINIKQKNQNCIYFRFVDAILEPEIRTQYLHIPTEQQQTENMHEVWAAKHYSWYRWVSYPLVFFP